MGRPTKDELRRARDTFHDLLETANTDKARLAEKIDDLEQRLEYTDGRLDERVRECAGLEQKLRSGNALLELASIDKARLAEQIDGLEVALEGRETVIANIREQLRDARLDADTQRKLNKSLEFNNAAYRGENVKLQTDLDEAYQSETTLRNVIVQQALDREALA